MSEDLNEEQEAEMTRFVPIQRQELVNLMKEELINEPDQLRDFTRFAVLLRNTLHFEFHEAMERIKTTYRPLDPDPVAPSIKDAKFGVEPDSTAFHNEFTKVLEKANFKEVKKDELNHAFEARSLFSLDSQVDLEEFSEVLLFRRGMTTRKERIRGLGTFFKWKEIEIETFDRMVMGLRLKPEALEAHSKTHRVKEMKPGKVYLKYFKNIPKADVEMIFPNTKLRMGSVDRIKVGLPIVSGLGTAGIKLIAVAGVAFGAGTLASTDDTSLQTTGALLAALCGYMLRSFNGYKNTKISYMQTITEGLYFKNLDNNAGVLHHLISAAEEEEVKESLLAYYFLMRSDTPLSKGELDVQIERWFATRFDRHFDFEVEDGLAKLKRLKLIEGGPKSWKAVELKEALDRLDEAWDGYFDYHHEK